MSEDQSNSEKELVIELKVYMHCKACERSVFKVLRKFKGVITVDVDMNKKKAIVSGQFEPEKVLKKLRKKTGKRAEILSRSDIDEVDGNKSDDNPTCWEWSNDGNGECESGSSNSWENSPSLNMFSDENPNACSIV